jgi:hypothetical protein
MSKREDEAGFHRIRAGDPPNDVTLRATKDPGHDRLIVEIVFTVDGLALATSPFSNPDRFILERAEYHISELRAKLETEELHERA